MVFCAESRQAGRTFLPKAVRGEISKHGRETNVGLRFRADEITVCFHKWNLRDNPLLNPTVNFYGPLKIASARFSWFRSRSSLPGRRLNLQYGLTKGILKRFLNPTANLYGFQKIAFFAVSTSAVSPGSPIKFTVVLNRWNSKRYFLSK